MANLESTKKKFDTKAMTRIIGVALIAGLIGWAYEVFVCGPLNGESVNLQHGGLGIPFLTIYAVGAFLIDAILTPRIKDQGIIVQMLSCAILCTVLEYATGLFMLHVLGVRTWDYRVAGWDTFASKDGLICLRAFLTFGIAGAIIIRWVDPWLSKLSNKETRLFTILTAMGLTIVIAALLNAGVFHVIDTGTVWQ